MIGLLPALATFAIITAPVPSEEAELRNSIFRFCSAAAAVNLQFISAQPDSPLGRKITTQLADENIYRTLWSIAKATNIPACRSIW